MRYSDLNPHSERLLSEKKPDPVSFAGAEEIIDSNDLDYKTERRRYAKAMERFLGIPLSGPNCKDYAYGITREQEGEKLRPADFPEELRQAMIDRDIPLIRSAFETYMRKELAYLGKELVSVPSNDYVPREGERMIALATAPRTLYNPEPDYHFFVKGKDGLWSHKPGMFAVTDRVGLRKIEDPATCDYKIYVDFIGYYVIRDNGKEPEQMNHKSDLRSFVLDERLQEQTPAVFDVFKSEFEGTETEKMEHSTNLLEKFLDQQERPDAGAAVIAGKNDAEQESSLLNKLSRILEVLKEEVPGYESARFRSEDLYTHKIGLLKTEGTRKAGPGKMAFAYDAPTLPDGEKYDKYLRLGEFDPAHTPPAWSELEDAMASRDNEWIKMVFEPHMRSDLAYLGKELFVAPSPDYVPREGERMIALAVSPSTFQPFFERSPDYRVFVKEHDGAWSYKDGLGDPVTKADMDLYADYLDYEVVQYYLIREKSPEE